MTNQLILHIPHASVAIPDYTGFVISKGEIEKEILKMTDWYTNDLFYSVEDEMVIADFSRIFCDVERFCDDEQEVMAQFGLGVLYEKNDAGCPIRTISQQQRAIVLNNYYIQHHRKLSKAVENQLKRFDKALIIDCHSFSNVPFLSDLVQESYRPDFNIGTDPFHTPKELICLATSYFAKLGYSVGIDSPYQGSIVPMEFYQKNNNVYSIMLEVNRNLYLAPNSIDKSTHYPEIKDTVFGFMAVMRAAMHGTL